MGLFSKKEPAHDLHLQALEQEYQNFRRRTAQELEQAHTRAAR